MQLNNRNDNQINPINDYLGFNWLGFMGNNNFNKNNLLNQQQQLGLNDNNGSLNQNLLNQLNLNNLGDINDIQKIFQIIVIIIIIYLIKELKII